MISDEQIAEWRKLADAATPGPWESESDKQGQRIGQWEIAPIKDNELDWSREIAAVISSHKDALFIAASREAVPALIEELFAMGRRLAWALKILNEFQARTSWCISCDADISSCTIETCQRMKATKNL